MSKNMTFFLRGIMAVMLLGSGVAMSSENAMSENETEVTSLQTVAPTPEDVSDVVSDAGLTPKRKPVVRAQQGLVPRPPVSTERVAPPQMDAARLPLVAALPEAATPAPAPAEPNAYVYAEIERLSAEVAKLKKDTKKPDTKKAWGSPKVTGRLFLDTYAIDQDNDSRLHHGDVNNKGGIREMQIAVSGKGFDSFDYKLEFSLAPNNGRVNLVDNWIGVKHVPLLGYVRAGHFKPETGLAYPASALHTTLTEFTGPSSSFGLGRRFGVASENLFAHDRIRLFMGVFQEGATNTNRYIEEDNQGQVFNMRLSTAPIYEQEGRYVLHFGGHYSYVSPKDAATSMSANYGSLGWLPSSLSTGTFANNHHHRFGVEAAWQAGAFAVQSEAFFAKYAAYGAAPERTAKGAYVELKYFLTGEHRTYGLEKGMFGAAKVKRNFHPHKYGDHNLIDGFGAWQAVVQWSYLDLTDWRAVNGNAGMQHDLTLGLNWFWTPNIRWIFEYVHSQQNTGATHYYCYEDIFGTSLRVHF